MTAPHLPDLASLGKLIGDPARAAMLDAMMGGVALPAGELARAARIGAPAASAHLAKLSAGGLIQVLCSGRHRYYRLAGAQVATLIETVGLAAPARRPRGLSDSLAARHLQRARCCYDHLAGQTGVALTQRLVEMGWLGVREMDFSVLPPAQAWWCMHAHGEPPATSKFCIDWTERKPHVSGPFGKALCGWMFDSKWIARMNDSRAVRITPRGQIALRELFELKSI